MIVRNRFKPLLVPVIVVTVLFFFLSAQFRAAAMAITPSTTLNVTATPSVAATVNPTLTPSAAATANSTSTPNAAATANPTSTPNAAATSNPASTPNDTTTPSASNPAIDLCSTVVFGDQAGTPAPTPAAPKELVTKNCDNAKIEIAVSSPDRFGNRIGDVITVDVKITIDPSVSIDFTSLKQGSLKLQEKSPLTLALENPVTILGPESKDGKNIYRLQVRVQDLLPAPVAFSLDLRYQIGKATTDWKVLTTPDFLLTNSLTVDNGSVMLEGDLSSNPVPEPWSQKPLLLLAFVFILTPLANEVRIWIKRSRPGYVPSAIETAWRLLNPILADSKCGFNASQARVIEQALRGYLMLDYPHILSMTRQEIAEQMTDDARSDKVVKVLSLCDRGLYQVDSDQTSIVIASDDAREVVSLLKQVIPEER